jgi:glucokinase
LDFPFPVLLCDIGGTNARFALKVSPDSKLQPGPQLKTSSHASFEAALAAAFGEFDIKPRSLIACAAGPVSGRCVKLTNAAWSIDGAAVAAELGLDQGLLLNDFEAQALALPALEAGWTTPIGPALEPQRGVKLVIGIGTGLGAAALVNVEGRHLALASEAGHVDFAPVGSVESAIWPHIDISAHGRVSAETILSGQGLVRLHQARCAAAGAAPPALDEVALVQQALTQPDGPEARTLRLIWTLTARYAGDFALNLLATGGVTFSGGILPRLAAFLEPSAFRARFEDKAPFGDLMRHIPTRLVIASDAVLPGMAAIAAIPGNYIIDYSSRAWR